MRQQPEKVSLEEILLNKLKILKIAAESAERPKSAPQSPDPKKIHRSLLVPGFPAEIKQDQT